MKENDVILDDFDDGDINSSKLNRKGTWEEWLRGILFGGIFNIIVYFAHFKIVNSNALNGRFFTLSFVELSWNYLAMIFWTLTFFSFLFYNIFSKSWNQSLYKLLLLSLASAVLNMLVLNMIIYHKYDLIVWKQLLYDMTRRTTYVLILRNIIFFLVVFSLFKKKFRLIGLILIIASIILLGRSSY